MQVIFTLKQSNEAKASGRPIRISLGEEDDRQREVVFTMKLINEAKAGGRPIYISLKTDGRQKARL